MHLETGEGVHTGRAYRAGSLIAHVVTGKLDVRAAAERSGLESS